MGLAPMASGMLTRVQKEKGGVDEALSQATRAAQRLSRKLPKLEGKAAAGGGELVRRREVHLWTVVAELGRLEAELEKSEAAGQRLRREVWRLKK